MIYKLKIEGYEYPVRVNVDLIPIMYIRKMKRNWYELAIVGTQMKLFIIGILLLMLSKIVISLNLWEEK